VEENKIIIKRYINRKLYNTEQKKYITLENIAELIRLGSEVQVIDNKSGEDITALTLTLIILEQEKKQTGVLSNSLLTTLIRAGEDSLSSLQRNFQSSLNFWYKIDDEINDRIQKLVKLGEISTAEAEKLIDKLLAQSPIRRRSHSEEQQTSKVENKNFEEYITENHIPSQNDINQIYLQLEELSQKIEEVVESQS